MAVVAAGVGADVGARVGVAAVLAVRGAVVADEAVVLAAAVDARAGDLRVAAAVAMTGAEVSATAASSSRM